jgi:hypothetical protein
MRIVLVFLVSILSFSAVSEELAPGTIQLADATSCINSCKTDRSACQQKCDQVYFDSSARQNDSTCKLNCGVSDNTCESACH